MTDIIVRLKALSPIAHGSFGPSAGNATLLRRMALVSLPGMPRIPCVSGNALRGIARRIVMRDLFDRAGINRETLPGGAWDRLYAALANGGHLDGSEGKIVPDEVRALRESLPPLSVFGAALYSRFLAGHLSMGIGWLRCAESVSAGVVTPGESENHAEDMVEEISHCRHVDREYQDPELSGVTPMPTTTEAISAGAVIESRVSFASHATDVERGAVLFGLTRATHIGGHAAKGLGRVGVSATLELDSAGHSAMDLIASYHDWLDETNDIGERLRSLSASLGRPKMNGERRRKK